MKFNSLEELLNQTNQEPEPNMSTGTPASFRTDLGNLPDESAQLPKSNLQDPGLRQAEAALANLPEDVPAPPESQLQRLERMAQELQQNRAKELEQARKQQLYADALQGVKSNLGLIVGGAQAMNTKAAVQAPKLEKMDTGDAVKQVSERYKTDQEAIMEKYKALLKAQEDAKDRALKGDDDWYKQAMLEERRADRELRQNMFDRGQDYREEKGDRLSDKQTGEIESLDNALYMVDRIETEKPKFNTGPIKSRVQGALSTVGIEDPEFAAFKSRTIDTLSDYVKSKSGLQVTDAERKALEQVVPNASMDDDTFKSTLSVFKERLADIRAKKASTFQKQGKNVKAFEEDQQPETKIVNGVTYKKVSGGWQKVK
jgi:hypothetical protein